MNANGGGGFFSPFQTRRIYLKITHNLAVDSFLMAQTGSLGGREIPCAIYSDSETNPVCADSDGECEPENKPNSLHFAGWNGALIHLAPAIKEKYEKE